MSKDGGPAFPFDIQMDQHGGRKSTEGMTLRDYFAAAALPACYEQVCRYCAERGWPEDWRQGVADDAYKMADAMLAERDKS